MTIKRLDHVSVVVEDLAAAIEGEARMEGPWVDRINASRRSRRRTRWAFVALAEELF